MNRFFWGVLALVFLGCGSTSPYGPGPDFKACELIEKEGVCEAEVTVDPQDPESQDEAVTLEVTWTWRGYGGPPIFPKWSRHYLLAHQALSLKKTIEDEALSPCVIELPQRSARCFESMGQIKSVRVGGAR